MQTIHFNMKSVYGIETVDSCSRSDWDTNKAFKAEIRSMLSNYHQCGMPVYLSQRCTNDYKTN